MKLRGVVAVAGIAISGAASAGQSGVQFDVVPMRDGKVVSSPRVIAEFGKKVALAEGARFVVRPRLVELPGSRG